MKRLLLLFFLLSAVSFSFAQSNISVFTTNPDNTYEAGEELSFSIIVVNNGPQPATNVRVNYPIPTGMVIPTGIKKFWWSGSNGSMGTNNPLNNTVATLGVNQSVTYTVHIRIPNSYTGTLPLPTVTYKSVADIEVVNTNNQTEYVPGQVVNYTITVTNNGPEKATMINVGNPIPLGITNFSWTGSNGSSGTNVALSNNIAQIAVGETVTYNITLQVPTTFTGNLTSQVNVSSTNITDPVPGCTQCVDTDTPKASPQADLVVVNTNNQVNYTPGGSSTYTVTLTNQGPDPARDVEINNTIPAGIDSFIWTSSTGTTGTEVDLFQNIPVLQAGETITYTINTTSDAAYSAPIISTVTVTSTTTDPEPDCVACTDTDVSVTSSDIVVVNTNNQLSYTAGGQSVYTVEVTNNGPADAVNVTVSGAIPAGITSFSWTGDNGTSGTNTSLQDVIATLPVGQTITYTVTIDVPAGYSDDFLEFEVTTVNDNDDPDPSCGSCKDVDYNSANSADIVVVNTNGQQNYTPGTASVYTVTVTNNGPAAAQNVHVQNAIPQGITQFSWVGSNGSSGTNVALDDTIAALAASQTVTYTITLQVPVGFEADITSETIVESATDPDASCAACIDTDTLEPTADIVVVNTDDKTFYIPGTDSVYTITVTNNGPTAAQNIQVDNAIPTGITSFSWTGSNGSSGIDVALSDNIAALAVGESVTYTVTIAVPNSFTGSLTSETEVTSGTPDPDTTCAGCIDTNIAADADVVITHTLASGSTYTAGLNAVYTVTVANQGTTEAVNVALQNVLPADIDAATVTWTGSNGTSGTGSLNDVIAVLDAGETITYQLIVPVPSGYDPAVNLVNVISATSDIPNTAPTCTGCTNTATPNPQADLVTLKTNFQTEYLRGETTTYTITVTNPGPSDAYNVNVVDMVPYNIELMVWSGYADVNGSGSMNVTIPVLPAGEIAQYTVKLNVRENHPEFIPGGLLVNEVAVTSDTPDPNPACPGCKDTDEPRGKFVTISTTDYTVPELVEDIMINQECSGIENLSWVTGSDFGQAQSIGYFHRNNSDFPIKEGIILQSGNVLQAGGPKVGVVSTPAPGWAGDTDLFNYIDGLGIDPGLSDYNDATVLEFDFLPLGNYMSFDFIFASEEYGQWQCQYADAFAFFLTNTVTGEVKNLAVLPSTTTPISVLTIRNSLYNGSCTSQNAGSFHSYYGGDVPASLDPADAPINFKGFTEVLTAQSSVVPNQMYHLKLVIADRNDNILDAAVFIENKFTFGQPELPEDISFANQNQALCDGEEYTLQVDTHETDYIVQWKKDGIILRDENDDPITSNSIVVTEPATYTVLAYPLFNPTCALEDEIVIDYLPPIPAGQPNDITICSNTGGMQFNLAQNISVIEAGLTSAGENPAFYDITFYVDEDLAEGGYDETNIPAADLPNFVGADGQVIYVRVADRTIDCYIIKSFTLHALDCNVIIQDPQPMAKCEIAPYDTVDEFNLTLQEAYILNGLDSNDYTITYHYTSADANMQSGPTIPTPSAYQGTNEVVYIRVENKALPAAYAVTQMQLIVTPQPDVDDIADVTVCSADGYVLPVLTSGAYYTQTNGQGTMLVAGDIVTTTQTIYVYEKQGTAPYTCQDEKDFTVTVVNSPVADVLTDQTACNSYTLPALTSGDYFDQPGGLGNMLSAGDVITSSQTLYIYAQAGSVPCTDESSFDITIVPNPVADVLPNVTQCLQYELPALNAGNNYYTATNAGGTMLSAGDIITTTQDIYIYAETGTTPNCTDESM
uniref:choice-of-anchor L domain-containing protein n=1 Tax=Flavobacterium sp. MK4S-17 TaxID=2543737 RepID=UPI00135BC3BD